MKVGSQAMLLTTVHDVETQESPANAKVNARQQCVHESPLTTKSIRQINARNVMSRLTTPSLTIRVYLHSFSHCRLPNLRNSERIRTYSKSRSIENVYATSYCRNGYGSVCEHNNTTSIRLNLFSFIVIISHSFTCFRDNTIKSETLSSLSDCLTVH